MHRSPSKSLRCVLAVAAVTLLASACGGASRASHRLKKIEVEGDSGYDAEWKISYGDGNAVDKIEVTGDLTERTYTFEYDGTDIVKIEEEFEDDTAESYVHDFEWASGQLMVKESRRRDSFDQKIEYDYSDGPLTEIEAERDWETGEQDARGLEWDWRFKYDGSDLEKVDGDFTPTGTDEGFGEYEVEYKVSYDNDGRIEEIEVDEGGVSIEFDPEYSDDTGKVEVIDADGDDIEFEYDDEGRIEAIDEDNNFDWTFTYEEGSVDGLVFDPLGARINQAMDLDGNIFADLGLNTFSVMTTSIPTY